MAIANVTFIKYYNFTVEVDDDLYDKDPYEAEEQAIEFAFDDFESVMRSPIADCSYDEVEIEFE